MASKAKTTIAERLNAAQIAINNAVADPEIAEAVAEFGYKPEKMHVGKQLLEAAVTAVNKQKVETGCLRMATVSLQKAVTSARDAYQALAKVARASLSKAQLTSLGLNRRAPKAIAAFLSAGYSLFDNALAVPEVLEELTEYGYDAARLEKGRSMIAALDRANQVKEAAKGDAQQSTQVQKVALSDLYKWYAQFIKIARVALRDKKQLLEKLGIPARTSKTAARRASTQKAAETRTVGKSNNHV